MEHDLPEYIISTQHHEYELGTHLTNIEYIEINEDNLINSEQELFTPIFDSHSDDFKEKIKTYSSLFLTSQRNL
jgi:hypothetical protein